MRPESPVTGSRHLSWSNVADGFEAAGNSLLGMGEVAVDSVENLLNAMNTGVSLKATGYGMVSH